jgi:hypothetical protein
VENEQAGNLTWINFGGHNEGAEMGPDKAAGSRSRGRGGRGGESCGGMKLRSDSDLDAAVGPSAALSDATRLLLQVI